jgi:hypothetical protein
MVDVGSGGSMPPLRAANLLATIEGSRLHSADCAHWQRWGPYLSERQWGTVREDYSPNTAPPGTIFRTTMRAAARIAGVRTALPVSATTS